MQFSIVLKQEEICGNWHARLAYGGFESNFTAAHMQDALARVRQEIYDIRQTGPIVGSPANAGIYTPYHWVDEHA